MKTRLIEVALSFVGTQEATGNNDGPQVEAFQKAVDGKAQGEPWCFTGDVEILTRQGWTPFALLPDGVPVAQVDEHGALSFTQPIRVVRKSYTGPGFRVKTRSLNFTVDEGHRFWGRFNNALNLEFSPLSRVTHSLQIPACYSAGKGVGLTPDEIALLAAFMADGFLHKTRQGVPRIRVQVSKARELETLRAMAPASVYTAARTHGPLTKELLTTFGFEVPEKFAALFEGYKLLKWDTVWAFTPAEAALFLEFYGKFDGSQRSKTSRLLFVTDTAQRDRLLALVVMAGYIPSVTTQRSPLSAKLGTVIRYCIGKKTRTVRRPHITRVDLCQEPLFCVEVPQGRILVRDAQGNPFVTGNCMAFVQFCVQQVDRESAIEWDRDYLADTEHCLTAWNKSPDEARSFVPGPGKIIIWAKDDQSGKGHTGIITSINDDGTFNTVEGNTSSGTGDPREGDGVYARRRDPVKMGSLVVLGFIDPWPWE